VFKSLTLEDRFNRDSLFPRESELLDLLFQVQRHELRAVFRRLRAPSMLDVYGEYDAGLLDQGDAVGNFLVRNLFRCRGPWIGKAFRPLSESTGEGYNAFGTMSRRRVELPMDTYLAKSNLCDGDSFVLDYRGKHLGPISFLRGELRYVSRSLLLGMGLFGPRCGQCKRLRRVIPFVLVGPVRAYQAEPQRVVKQSVIRIPVTPAKVAENSAEDFAEAI
jgi:hypothetical protein